LYPLGYPAHTSLLPACMGMLIDMCSGLHHAVGSGAEMLACEMHKCTVKLLDPVKTHDCNTLM